jgi:hypothetical protein
MLLPELMGFSAGGTRAPPTADPEEIAPEIA